jgi:uncharacterized protein (TIGR03084 family)
MLQQAYDFRDESDAIHNLLSSLSEDDFGTVTQFKEWTINDVLAHLHHFNYLAVLSLTEEEKFLVELKALFKSWESGKTVRQATDLALNNISGRALFDLWHNYYLEMTEIFAAADPKKRVKWAGPDMSVISSITARLMETWSHGQCLFDILGTARQETDRIRNVAMIGMNTFGWTFINRGEDVPTTQPYVRLTAPSGEIWEWNERDQANMIEGDATGFCQVVTQTRNVGDTNLRVVGEAATRWMGMAQCFAGPPENQPAPGARSIVT